MRKFFVLAISLVLSVQLSSCKTGEKKVEYYDNGKKKAEGLMKDGKKEGLWKLWYDNGQRMAERYYKNGLRHGKSKAWYKNANLQGEANYENGKRSGLFTTWYARGSKQQESHFKQGLKDGKETHWYPNEKPKMEGNFQAGKAVGKWTLWDMQGNKTTELNYKDSLLHGKYTRWNKQGAKIKETEYRGGVKDIPAISAPYFGQKPPGMVPGKFAPGILSTGNQEIHCAFSLDGKEVYYSMADPLYLHTFAIYFMKEEKGRWSQPRLAPFNQPRYNSVSAFSPDGKRLYFNASPPGKAGDYANPVIDIWCVERTAEGWAKPYHLGPVVNSGKWDTYPSVSADGDLYFTSNRDGGKGFFDIYCSELKDGKYTPPVNLGDAVNTKRNERHACIAPDGSYILFDSDGFKQRRGVYVSFRGKDGSWSKARYLGKAFNALPVIYHVNISPDGRYIFTSGTENPNEQPFPNRDIYWADAKAIGQADPH